MKIIFQVLNLTDWLEYELKVCKCIPKNCSCGFRRWFCGDECYENCPCFKRGYFYCDGKRVSR